MKQYETKLSTLRPLALKIPCLASVHGDGRAIARPNLPRVFENHHLSHVKQHDVRMSGWRRGETGELFAGVSLIIPDFIWRGSGKGSSIIHFWLVQFHLTIYILFFCFVHQLKTSLQVSQTKLGLLKNNKHIPASTARS